MAASAVAVAEPMAGQHHHALTCGNHRPFASYGAALQHYIDQLRENRTDVGQEVFRCRACRQWHHGGGIVSLERLIREAQGLEDDR